MFVQLWGAETGHSKWLTLELSGNIIFIHKEFSEIRLNSSSILNELQLRLS